MFGTSTRRIARAACTAFALVFSFTTAAVHADDRQEASAMVERATATVRNFRADPNMRWFRQNLPRARGVMVVPELVKGGFIFGGSGGSGVLLGRTGSGFSAPAFYNMASVTFGLQIGAEVAEVVLLVMTQRGMDAMYSTEFKLGADVSIAAGPVGAGAQAATADVVAFSRAKGVFGGLTLEGAGLSPRDEWNSAYYGEPLRPLEIIVRGAGNNPHANGLRQALAGGAPRTASTKAADTAAAGNYDLLTIQRALKSKGFDPGTPDGRFGPATKRAIRNYQSANGLPVDGTPSLSLQRHLVSH